MNFTLLNQISSNLFQYFQGTGLFVFTNIPRPVRKYYRREQMEKPMADRPGAADKAAAKKGGGGDVKVRKDFREVFLWREVSITE